MRLRTADVDRYGPLRDCRPPCGDGLTVLSGPNEAGKTLYLEAVLQLLEPDVASVMNPGPRVDADPAGRAVIDHGGERYEFPGDASLSDVSEIEPSHLQSVFVVRDNDLDLPGDPDYYTSLIEKLGDIHTTEINAIKAELKERGRLTDRRLNVSSDQSFHNAGDVRDRAQELASDIREYTDEITEKGLDELETRLLRLKREFRRAREDLEVQETREKVAEYERLSEQLETYRSTSESLADLAEFDRETLEELRSLRSGAERDREDLTEVEAELEGKRAELAETEEQLETYDSKRAQLERREDAIENARDALESYRDRQAEATGAEDRRKLATYTTVAGLLGAGGAGIAGALAGSLPAIGLGVVLLVVAIGGGVAYRQSNQRLSAVENTRETVLETARDAGLAVSSVDDVAPAIESFDGDLEESKTQVNRTEASLDTLRDRIGELDAEQSDLEESIEDAEAELSSILEDADVDSIAQFEERVEEREDLETDRRAARQSLEDQFGTPDSEVPGDRIEAWEVQLEELVSDIDLTEVEADEYDETELQRLTEKVDELEVELAELDEDLHAYHDRLESFDRQARDLGVEPFLGRGLALEVHTREGLESLAEELEIVVDQIERDAELSRKALEVFEEIESREEQKLTELFDPDGPASRTFEELTGGRYTEVAYDPEAHALEVAHEGGRTFGPDVLSQGATDQLYFATRVSLAQQLLGEDTGFLLLDDPFLAADPERLTNGFDTLVDLADQGWQILYLTAKEEVSETMVEEYDLAHAEIEPPWVG